MGYPTSRIQKAAPNIRAQREQLQALTGALGSAAGKEAITRENFGSLGNKAIKSRFAGSAPTQAEYNALVEDVHAIANLLNQLGASFTGL